MDELDEIQKVLVNGLMQEPFYVATAFGDMNDLLQRFTKEYLEERFQEGISIIAKHDQRIVGVGLGRSLASVENTIEVFPQTPAAVAYKSLRSHLGDRMRQTNAAKETSVLFQNIAVSETHRRRGLYHSLMKERLDLVRSKGFKTVYAMSRTDHTSKRLQSADFEVVERISYSEFVFNGKKPFKSVASQLGGATLLAKFL